MIYQLEFDLKFGEIFVRICLRMPSYACDTSLRISLSPMSL